MKSKGEWGGLAQALYEGFLLQDLFGYAVPGALALFGSALELRIFDVHEFSSLVRAEGFLLLGFMIGISYVFGVMLRLIGTWPLPLLLMHRNWGLLGGGRIIPEDYETCWQRFRRYIQYWFWRPPSNWREFYNRLKNETPVSTLIRRETTFMHVTGLTAMACFAVAIVAFISRRDGLALMAKGRLSDPQIWIILLVAGFVLLLGHYRHSCQREMLSKNPPAKR